MTLSLSLAIKLICKKLYPISLFALKTFSYSNFNTFNNLHCNTAKPVVTMPLKYVPLLFCSPVPEQVVVDQQFSLCQGGRKLPGTVSSLARLEEGK